MIIPDTIRIGSMNYKVEITKEKIIVKNSLCYGQIDYEKHKISLSEDYCDNQGLELTFLHEIIHGIIYERNLDMSKKINEELLVEEISRGLHQLIKDNPNIFDVKKAVNE